MEKSVLMSWKLCVNCKSKLNSKLIKKHFQ